MDEKSREEIADEATAGLRELAKRDESAGTTSVVRGASGAPAVGVGIGGMARLAAAYETDANLENAGAWMTVVPASTTEGGVRFRVRSAQSTAARDIAKTLAQPYKALWASGGSLTPEQNDTLELDMCAQAYVTDWVGMTDAAGQPLLCTDANVRDVLNALPNLRRQVAAFAQAMENYRPQR